MTKTVAACVRIAAVIAIPALLAGCTSATPSSTTSTAASNSASAVASPSASPTAAASSAGPSASASASVSPSSPASASDDSAAKTLEENLTKDSGLDDANGTPDYTGTRTVTYQGTFSFEVPTAWAQGNSASDGVSATSNQGAFVNGTAPGVFVSTRSGAPSDVLANYRARGLLATCTAAEQRAYTDSRYTGVSQSFTACGTDQTGTASVIIVSETAGTGADCYLFDATLVEGRDATALANVIRTFTVL